MRVVLVPSEYACCRTANRSIQSGFILGACMGLARVLKTTIFSCRAAAGGTSAQHSMQHVFRISGRVTNWHCNRRGAQLEQRCENGRPRTDARRDRRQKLHCSRRRPDKHKTPSLHHTHVFSRTQSTSKSNTSITIYGTHQS